MQMKVRESSEMQSRKSSSFQKRQPILLQTEHNDEEKDAPSIQNKTSNLILFSKTSKPDPLPTHPIKPKDKFITKNQVFQEVQLIENIINKKIQLKKQRKNQLQIQIQRQMEQKRHLYNINITLETELNSIKEYKQIKPIESIRKMQLEEQIKKLQSCIKQKQRSNQELIRQTQMLAQTFKNMSKCRKQYVKSQVKKRSNKNINNQYLKELISELNSIKQVIQKKILPNPHKQAFK